MLVARSITETLPVEACHVTTKERCRMTTATDIGRQQTSVVGWRFRSDPLAQTFILKQGRYIGGVDLCFTVRKMRVV
ncbi:MAG: hypothetical protein PSN37_00855 [Alphaproteobacteria bacterium]|nr:hypothetical protein [Alphaproteobacteria bacterium]